MKATHLFRGGWTGVWATTYQVELEFFDGFLFPRLGEPPLNATVLADFEELTYLWDRMADQDPWRLARVNRDYLLRGVEAGGAFHAKTYLFAREKDGLLVVGSGNLTRHGLDMGHEIFATFGSDDPGGLAAIRAWTGWMGDLVEALGDESLAGRWFDLRRRAPWLAGPIGEAAFITNREADLLSAFTAGVPRPVAELHATAPFFDREASALRHLIELLRPRCINVYLSGSTSVDGPALRAVLQDADGEVRLWFFHPDQFVHAKLVGLVNGKEGRLLSGSANLSQAALLSVAGREPWANVEAGVLEQIEPAALRSLFTPPGLSLVERDLASLDNLVITIDPSPRGWDLRLHRAAPREDGRIQVAVHPDDAEIDHLFLVAGGGDPVALTGRLTDEPLEPSEDSRLVWLADDTGAQCSNRVPLDDPPNLQGWLRARDSGVARPAGLDDVDLGTPIGQMLQRLNNACIFDLDDTEALRRAQQVHGEEPDAADDPGFWDRLAQEELRFDPRSDAYRRFGLRGEFPLEDEILALMHAMLERVPADAGSTPKAGEDREDPADGNGRGTPWTPDQRLQLRLFNVLQRWSSKLDDPRLAWLDPLAPVRNFLALLGALLECWQERYLSESRLVRLSATLVTSFIGTGERGYLSSLDEEAREAALERVPGEAPQAVAALAWLTLRDGGLWRDQIFLWQRILLQAEPMGMIEQSEAAAGLVTRLGGPRLDADELASRVRWAMGFRDDGHWCRDQAEALGLRRVTLRKGQAARPVVLGVEGTVDQFDPVLVRLVRATLDYKGDQGLAIDVNGERMITVLLGSPLRLKVDGGWCQSPASISVATLRALETDGRGFGDALEAGAAGNRVA